MSLTDWVDGGDDELPPKEKPCPGCGVLGIRASEVSDWGQEREVYDCRNRENCSVNSFSKGWNEVWEKSKFKSLGVDGRPPP